MNHTVSNSNNIPLLVIKEGNLYLDEKKIKNIISYELKNPDGSISGVSVAELTVRILVRLP